jgi:hypothetical protein
MPCPPPEEQARQFLAWLKARCDGEREFAHHMEENLYPSFCAQKEWRPRPWNTLAGELRKLTGGEKDYEWVEDRYGDRHRLRIYRLWGAKVVPFEVPLEQAKRKRA